MIKDDILGREASGWDRTHEALLKIPAASRECEDIYVDTQ